MFKNENRLMGGVSLSKTQSFPFFTIKTGPNNLGRYRFRIVISKKIDKRAVVRNRIRRKIKECIKEVLKEKHESKDCLIIVRKNILDEDLKFSPYIKEALG